MFYFNKEEKNEHDFFISYSQFSFHWLCQFQACPSPPGISRAFVILLVPAVGNLSRKPGQLTTGKVTCVHRLQERARKELNATSGAQFAALPLVKPVVWFARAVVNWRSRSVAKSAYLSQNGVHSTWRCCSSKYDRFIKQQWLSFDYFTTFEHRMCYDWSWFSKKITCF